MAHPLALLAGAAAGLFGLKYLKDRQTKAASDYENALSKVATSLQKGKSYSVQMAVNPSAPDFPPEAKADPALAGQWLASFLTSTGWKVLMTPQLRNPDASTAWKAGQPAEWVWNGTWTLDAPFYLQGAAPPQWLGMTMPYQIPSA